MVIDTPSYFPWEEGKEVAMAHSLVSLGDGGRSRSYPCEIGGGEPFHVPSTGKEKRITLQPSLLGSGISSGEIW